MEIGGKEIENSMDGSDVKMLEGIGDDGEWDKQKAEKKEKTVFVMMVNGTRCKKKEKKKKDCVCDGGEW